MKIIVTYDPPPISDRRFDWCAVDDATYEAGCPVGYGPTAGRAVEDLIFQIQENAQ